MSETRGRAEAGSAVGELAVIQQLWPLLVISGFSWLPSTALALLLVPIAEGLGASVAVVGGMRGLGGLTALVAGVLAVPLVDRYPRAWSIAASLAAIAAATVAPTVAGIVGLALYAMGLGAAQAVLLPAVQAAAADEGSPAVRVRGASLVAACASLGPMLAGVVLTVPVVLFGWRGAFGLMALGSALLVILAVRKLSRRPPVGIAGPRYLATFPLILAAPGALALLLEGTLRACAWFTMTAYLSALLAERFGFEPVAVGLVWSGNAAVIFCGNLTGGRIASGGGRAAGLAPLVGSLLMLVSGPVVYLAPVAPAALGATWTFAFGMGLSSAGLTAILVHRFVALRGPLLGFSAAGVNLGVFAGAAVGALALAAFGYPGVAATVGLLLVLTCSASAWAWRTLSRAPQVR